MRSNSISENLELVFEKLVYFRQLLLNFLCKLQRENLNGALFMFFLKTQRHRKLSYGRDLMLTFLIRTLRVLLRFQCSWMRWKEDALLFPTHPRTLKTEQYSQCQSRKSQGCSLNYETHFTKQSQLEYCTKPPCSPDPQKTRGFCIAGSDLLGFSTQRIP